MIIQSLVATNFRKYEHLEIKDIPKKGLILVSGNNESGKTSIADTLSFVLFGRTFLTDVANAHKLVRWGEKFTLIKLRFLSKSKSYLLTRLVSKTGKMEATLTDCDADKVLASDVVEVEQVLNKVLGYSYDTFSDSYYLVQRELSAPKANSDSVKDMIGIGAYADVSKELHKLNHDDNHSLKALYPEYDAVNKQLEGLGIDEAWLPELVSSRDGLEVDDGTGAQLLTELKSSSRHYKEDKASHQKATRQLKRTNLFSDIMLALLFIGLLVWVALKFFPEKMQQYLMPDAPERFLSLLALSELWLPISVGIVAVLFFISMLWGWRINDKTITSLNARSRNYSDRLSRSYTYVKSGVDTIAPRSLKLLSDSAGSLVAQTDPNHVLATISTFAEQVESYQVDTMKADQITNGLRKQIKERQAITKHHLGVLGSEIDLEMERTSEAAGYRQQLTAFRKKIRKYTYNIKVRDLSIELLYESAKEFTEGFNKSITKVSAKILPLFTHDHYSNVKIDENLSIAVFSKEKNDFMDFDEISSGTQRQIMLALRIAMSEELAKNN
ncbi:MAG TPA: hypothetical protein EYH35_00195, partial [Thiotrichaceae bacterium]|nr:hypothetical protein [Thiotrichaceae bacterium]